MSRDPSRAPFCKNCAFLSVPLNAAGRRQAIKWRMYDCTAPEPEFPPIPASIEIKKYPRKMMCGDYGDGCPTFEPIKRRK